MLQDLALGFLMFGGPCLFLAMVSIAIYNDRIDNV